VPARQSNIVDAVATGAAHPIQSKFVVEQVPQGVAIGSSGACHVGLVVPLRRVAGRAKVLDGLAVRGVDQPLVVDFGLPKRVPRAVRHQRGLPVSNRADGCAIFIHECVAVGIWRMAIDAVA